MVLITIKEVVYLVLASFVVGYIFSGMIKRPGKDVLDQYIKRFDWDDLKFATLIAAPGIVFHELAHKFVAMGFGLNAFFEIWPTGLAIGVILKLIGSGFMILAPGYVVIPGMVEPIQGFLTAFAGPLMNLVFWLGAGYYLKMKKEINRDRAVAFHMFGEINKWLFIFNMIPLPPLDGAKVFGSLFSLLFS